MGVLQCNGKIVRLKGSVGFGGPDALHLQGGTNGIWFRNSIGADHVKVFDDGGDRGRRVGSRVPYRVDGRRSYPVCAGRRCPQHHKRFCRDRGVRDRRHPHIRRWRSHHVVSRQGGVPGGAGIWDRVGRRQHRTVLHGDGSGRGTTPDVSR